MSQDQATLFKRAFDSAASGMGITNGEGVWLFVNQALCNMVGYDADELRGTRFADITHPEDVDTDLALTRQLFAGAIASFEMDKRYLHKNGSIVHVRLRLATIPDESGRPAYGYSQIVDLTEQHRTEAALRDSEILFRTVAGGLPLGLFVDSAGGNCTYVNQAYEQLLGLPRERLLGRGWLAAVHPEDRPRVEASLIARTTETDGHQEFEHRYLRPDGHVHLARIRAYPLRDGDRFLGTVGLAEDITEARRAEEAIQRANAELERRVAERTAELEQANARLRRRNEELNDYSYAVAHDLRTPIRAIASFSELLRQDCAAALDEAGREYLQRILRATARTELIIEELLRLARTGSLPVERQCIDMQELAREVAARLGQAHAGTAVAVEIGELPAAHADPRMVPTLLENLLGNAWKYSARRAHPQVRVGFSESTRGGAYFIADNGAGFDPDLAGKLFKPFQRLHREAEFPGIGIGLSMAKRIVDLHGGAIWAEGRPDAGATFYFSLRPAGEGA